MGDWLETELTMVFFPILVADGGAKVRLRRLRASLSLFVQKLWQGLANERLMVAKVGSLDTLTSLVKVGVELSASVGVSRSLCSSI